MIFYFLCIFFIRHNKAIIWRHTLKSLSILKCQQNISCFILGLKPTFINTILKQYIKIYIKHTQNQTLGGPEKSLTDSLIPETLIFIIVTDIQNTTAFISNIRTILKLLKLKDKNAYILLQVFSKTVCLITDRNTILASKANNLFLFCGINLKHF